MQPTTNQLDNAIQSYVQQLSQIETQATTQPLYDPALFTQLSTATKQVLQSCLAFEQQATSEEVRNARIIFQEQTEPWIGQSYFIKRARIWPRGYMGDFETLEAFYHGYPPTKAGIGLYLDTYSLSSQLALGIRERRATLRERLAQELQMRPAGARLLNIACGSCRELFELGAEIQRHQPYITCLDSDVDALDYAKTLLPSAGLPLDRFNFVKYNALRLANYQKNRQLFGEQDIIYSAGLFDYIPDEPLVKILRALYQLLKPQGRFIAPFKDKTRYATGDYHWLSNWTGFLQRTPAEVEQIFAQAEIPPSAIQQERDKTGIMIFFTVTRES